MYAIKHLNFHIFLSYCKDQQKHCSAHLPIVVVNGWKCNLHDPAIRVCIVNGIGVYPGDIINRRSSTKLTEFDWGDQRPTISFHRLTVSGLDSLIPLTRWLATIGHDFTALDRIVAFMSHRKHHLTRWLLHKRCKNSMYTRMMFLLKNSNNPKFQTTLASGNDVYHSWEELR